MHVRSGAAPAQVKGLLYPNPMLPYLMLAACMACWMRGRGRGRWCWRSSRSWRGWWPSSRRPRRGQRRRWRRWRAATPPGAWWRRRWCRAPTKATCKSHAAAMLHVVCGACCNMLCGQPHEACFVRVNTCEAGRYAVLLLGLVQSAADMQEARLQGRAPGRPSVCRATVQGVTCSARGHVLVQHTVGQGWHLHASTCRGANSPEPQHAARRPYPTLSYIPYTLS
jgi:hypothetical protein